MSADAVIGWVLTTAAGLRLSQAKTLADLVGRGTLSAIGRCLPGTTAKHKIKRVWRFCDNDRVHPSDVMPRVIHRLTGKRKKPLLVALDWTERGAGVPHPHGRCRDAGRAVPLVWASYATGQLHKSQNSFEEGLLRLLLTMLPGGVKVILPADRGFGRAELAKTCEGLKLQYLQASARREKGTPVDRGGRHGSPRFFSGSR
jgi:hypothetical protein